MVDEVKKKRGFRTLHRKSPRYSHQSLGYAEQSNWNVESMLRVLLSSLEQHYRKVRSDEPIVAWAIRHAAWLLTRFRVRPDGRTSHFLLRRKNYTGEILEFGEVCWARDPRDAASRNKLDRRWTAQVWLGKVEASDEHVCSRSSRAEKYRTVRRRPESERWDAGIFELCLCTPWTDADQMADAAVPTRSTYITRARVREHGGTPGCGDADGRVE